MVEYASGAPDGACYRRPSAMMLDASPLQPHGASPPARTEAQTQQVAGDRGMPPGQAVEHSGVQEMPCRYETYYNDLIAGSLQGICMLQGDGVIQFVNPILATLFGYASPADLCGRDVRTLLAPHEHAPWEGYCHACLQAPAAPQRHIVQGIRQDQSALWLEICLSSTSWQGLPAMLVTCLDITERHHLETQVRQSHKMHALGALAGGIAHDFNNMLAAIWAIRNC